MRCTRVGWSWNRNRGEGLVLDSHSATGRGTGGPRPLEVEATEMVLDRFELAVGPSSLGSDKRIGTSLRSYGVIPSGVRLTLQLLDTGTAQGNDGSDRLASSFSTGGNNQCNRLNPNADHFPHFSLRRSVTCFSAQCTLSEKWRLSGGSVALRAVRDIKSEHLDHVPSFRTLRVPNVANVLSIKQA
jgi:hypothetical protein